MINPIAVVLGLAFFVLLVVTTWSIWRGRHPEARPGPSREVTIAPGRALAVVAILTLAAAFAHGVEATLEKDEAIFVYTDSVVADGHLPYVAAFDNTGPLGPLFGGLGVFLGRQLGLDDVTSARLAYAPLGLLAAVLLFQLARTSRLATTWAIAAGLALMAIPSFAREVVSGPRPKMLVVVFELAMILALSKRKWFVAGASVTLAALAWQAALVMLALPLVVALLQPVGQKVRSLGTLALGASAPVVALTAAYAVVGRTKALWEGAVTWNLKYAAPGRRPEWDALDTFVNPMKDAWGGNQISWPIVVLGFLVLLLLAISAFRRRGFRGAVSEEVGVWAALLVAIWVGWTLFDYQGIVDLLPFLPLGALGFTVGAAHVAGLTRRPERLFAGLMALLVLVVIGETIRSRNERLVDQKRTVAGLTNGSKEVVSYDEPQLLVLAGSRNPVRFFFPAPGLSKYLVERDRVESFVSSLLVGDPQVVGATSHFDLEDPVQAELARRLNAAYRPVEDEGIAVWVAESLSRRP